MSLIPKSRCAVSGRWTHTEFYIFTAHTWSLGQVNIFTPVCVILFGGVASQHASQVTWLGGLLTGGLAEPPTPVIHGILWDTVNKRVVRILLECILVPDFTFSLYFLPRGLWDENDKNTSNGNVESFWASIKIRINSSRQKSILQFRCINIIWN